MNKFVIKTKFYNFLFAKGIIKSPNWIFGGDWFCIKNKVYYLGIEDKNGKELCSNSMIKFGEQKGSVFYSNDKFSFKIKWEDVFIRDVDKSFIKQVEIIWYGKELCKKTYSNWSNSVEW